jgi:hypothetical protein
VKRSLQLADVIILAGEPTVEVAAELAAATLAELTGCALVAVATRHGILLAARPRQQVLVPPGDIERVAAEAYASLIRDGGVLVSRSATSAAFGSPLAEYTSCADVQCSRASSKSPRCRATSPSTTRTSAS